MSISNTIQQLSVFLENREGRLDVYKRQEEGMDFVIENKDIKGAHPNTAQIIMEAEGVPAMKIQAHSIGGGRIKVCKLDGIDAVCLLYTSRCV